MLALRLAKTPRWVTLPGLFHEPEAEAARALGWRVRPLVIVRGETLSLIDVPEAESPRREEEAFPDHDTGVVAKPGRGVRESA